MTRFILAVAAAVAGLSGCATPARYVERNKDGSGVVAIPMPTDTFPNYYYSEAKALIQRHAGANFEIVEEREVPVGQKTFNDQQVNNEQSWNSTNPLLPASKQTMQNTTTTQQVMEYRIWYRKKPSAMGMPAGTGSMVQPAAHSPAPGAGGNVVPGAGLNVVPGAGMSVYPAPGAQLGGASTVVPATGGQLGGASTVAPAGGPLAPVSPMGVVPAGPLAPTSPNGGTVYGSAGIVVGSMK